MNRRPRMRAVHTGFTLLEVMIAVLIVAIGLIGVAKMQALAIVNTQLSTTRSLIALQASSLASAMHGNKAFWATGTAPNFTVTPREGVMDANKLLAYPPSSHCSPTACTPTQQAAYDVNLWKDGIVAKFPGFQQALVTFRNVAGSPVTCTLTVVWSEKNLGMNSAAAASASSSPSAPQSYTLYIEP